MSARFNLRGKLTLTVHSARALANKELVGKMDPFVVVTVSDSKDEKFKTKVAKDQHQTPVWEQSYIFNLDGREELMHCNVWNEATLGDDHIGRLDLSLDAMDMSGKPRWYAIKDKTNFSKQTGEVSISVKFEGSGLPENSLAFSTHQSRVAPPAAAATPAASPVSPAVIQPATPAQATIAPPVVQQPAPQVQYQSQPVQQQQQAPYQSQQPNYQQPPPQQQFQQPMQQQQPHYSQPQQQPMQPQYQSQQPQYQPPQQPMYQQPPQPVYGAPPMQPIYQSQAPVYQQPQPVYQSQPVYQQPATITFQPQPVAVMQPTVVYQSGYPGAMIQPVQQQGQLIGYWPNGQPRYAGQ